jgi:hypothetical protein
MRLYFHLTDSHDTIRDVDGVEVSDLEEARTEAKRAIAEMRLEDPSAPQDWSGWTLRVTDESGRVLLTLDLDCDIH